MKIEKLVKEMNNPYGGKSEERFQWAKIEDLKKYIDKKEIVFRSVFFYKNIYYY